MYRVRTQIFGSKIQDFSKTVLYFSRLKVNKQVVYRDLENTGNQAFFMMHCKFSLTTVQCGHKRIMKLLILWLNVSAMGEIEWNLTTGKKIETSYYFSRLFSGLKNCWASFKTFKNSRLCTSPGVLSNHSPSPLAERNMASLGTCQQHGGNHHHPLYLLSN